LRERDPELYYTNIGGGSIYWDWMPFAYEREMPVINFRYNRRVRSMDEQMGPDSPFRAEPRYVIASADQPAPPNAEVIHTVGDLNVWYRPDVLPFAFSVPAGGVPSPETAVTQTVRLDGPNRVIVEGTADEGDQLVVLVSDYPGWRLEIDGQRADVEPLNGYLGATMETGIHTYRFSFQPVLHTLGLLLTLAGLAGCVGLVAWDFRHDRATAMAVTPQPMVQDGSWMDADGDAYRAENI
jgi:hypothetical protein